MINLYLIMFLILTVVVFNLLSSEKKIEGFDLEFKNKSLNECMRFCKTTAGCESFSYDKNNKICYPSKEFITSKPLNAPYKDKYSVDNLTCNKIKPIDEASKIIPLIDRRSNSIYVCTENKEKFPQYLFHNEEKISDIGEGKIIDEIFDVDNYSVDDYNWDNRYQINKEYSYFQDPSLFHKYKTDDPSDIEKVLLNEKLNFKENSNEKYIEKGLIEQNVDKIVNKTNDAYNKLLELPNVFKREYVKNIKPNSNNVVYYEEINGMNQGNIMRNYECVKNIPKDKCANHCTINEKCVGFEHNLNFENNKDVCCFYSSNKIVPRTDNKSLGKYYRKINNLNNASGKFEIIF